MDSSDAILALSALAQPTRLDVFRTLVRAEPEGRAAGEIADELGVPNNTLSAHLSILARAGLVESERRGRTIIYRAGTARVRDMVVFLLKDCCGGTPELCAPVVAALSPCCERASA